MERMVKDGISILYDKSIWGKNGRTTKSLISNFLILIVTLVSLSVFIYLVYNSHSRNMNIIYAISIIANQKILTDIVEKLVYRKTLGVYKLIRWVHKLPNVSLQYTNNKLFVIRKLKLFTIRTNLEHLLKKFKCKYEISYVNRESNRQLVINIDAICFDYIRIDIVE